MRSFSDELPSAEKVVTPEQLDAAIKAEVDKLRSDMQKSHFWITVAIVATLILSASGIILTCIAYH